MKVDEGAVVLTYFYNDELVYNLCQLANGLFETESNRIDNSLKLCEVHHGVDGFSFFAKPHRQTVRNGKIIETRYREVNAQ